MVRRMRSCSICKRSFISTSNLIESCIECREDLEKKRIHIDANKQSKINSLQRVNPQMEKTLSSKSVQEKQEKRLQNENKHLNIHKDPLRVDTISFSSSCEKEAYSNDSQPRKKKRIDLDSKMKEEPINDSQKNLNSKIKTTTQAVCLSDPNYACIICGCSLSHIKSGMEGKLNHLKRCAKKNSVSLQDIRNFSPEDGKEGNSSYPNDSNSDALNAKESKKENIESKSTNDSQQPNTYKSSTNEIIDLISSDDDDNFEDLANEKNSFVSNVKDNGEINIQVSNDRDQSISFDASSTSQQTSLTKFFTTPVKSINSVLLEGAKKIAELNKKGSINANTSNSRFNFNLSTRKRQWSQRTNSKTYCPDFKRIPTTNFICDGFKYAKPTLAKKYFLTHFHSDHYGGITSKWESGIIYCSHATANLVHEQLGVHKQYIKPLPMNTPTTILDTYLSSNNCHQDDNDKPIVVTLLDANHCPGAIMFLFQIGEKQILHVGDFRWDRTKMLKIPSLATFASSKSQLDILMLDTTYCNEKYSKLPSQEEAIQAAIDVMKKEIKLERSMCRTFFKSQNSSKDSCVDKTLFLFGSYSIGKERIYVSVAKHFGKKVYVDPRRLKLIKAFHWPAAEMNIFTTNKSESDIWVVPLGHIRFETLTEKYLGKSISNRKGLALPHKYDRVVGFRPTGWAFSPTRKDIISKKTNNKCVIYGVPYSEHSSFGELVDCLICLKPKEITPTVSVSKSQEQVELLMNAVRSKRM